MYIHFASSPGPCQSSQRKQLTFRNTTAGFPTKWCLRNEVIRHSLTCQYPDLGSAPDWLQICFNQSEALPRFGLWRVISMEFLGSFLRCNFAWKPVVALQNDGCFLRLMFRGDLSKFHHSPLNCRWPPVCIHVPSTACDFISFNDHRELYLGDGCAKSGSSWTPLTPGIQPSLSCTVVTVG